MKAVNLCVVVFNRYDLLGDLFVSLNQSTVQPDRVYLMDRGHQRVLVEAAIDRWSYHTAPVTHVELMNQSLTAAWNWFSTHVAEERIIAGDDVVFHPRGLEQFVTASGPLVGIEDGKSSPFGCFLLRNTCIDQVGLFDEALTAGYMYWDDLDYARRMRLLGLPITMVTGAVNHGMAQTLERKTPEQIAEHHRKFVIVRENYRQKWGDIEPEFEHEWYQQGVMR